MEILFFASIVGYFAATVLQTMGVTLRKTVLCRAAHIVFLISFALRIGSATFSYASFAIVGSLGVHISYSSKRAMLKPKIVLSGQII